MGRLVPEDEAVRIPAHGYQLTSVYQPSLSESGTGSPWSAGLNFTFCGTPNRPVDGLDQCWHTGASLRRVGRRALFVSEEQRLRILASGLPSACNPSDHVPIGAAFRWATDTTLPELRAAESARGGDQQLSGEEAVAEALALLEATPFSSAEQRARFEAASEEVAGANCKGKPPPEVHAVIMLALSCRLGLTVRFVRVCRCSPRCRPANGN